LKVLGRLLFFGLLVLITSEVSLAQRYNIKTFSVNDGLPSSQVYDVYLDEYGYIWFGTATNLVKFDGKRFEIIPAGADDLKDVQIYDVHEDADGEFWISTDSEGLAVMEDGVIKHTGKTPFLDSVYVNIINEFEPGILWFGTNKHGVYVWDKKEDSFTHLDTNSGLSDNQIWDIYQASDGRIWLSTMNGVSVYDPQNHSFHNLYKKDGLSGEYVYHVFESRENEMWISTSNGVTIINKDNKIRTLTEIEGESLGYVYGVNQDKDGYLWIGTERNGLFLYHEDEQGNVSSEHITKRQGLSSNNIYRLVKDASGTIWIATDGNGVSIFKDREFTFFDGGSDLDANSVFATKKTKDGSIWITTENGISKYKDGVFTNITIPEKIIKRDEIWDIEELPNGNLIFSTYNYDIIEFDGKNFFRPQFYDSLYQYFINDIMVDTEGGIWFATTGELIYYKNGTYKKFKADTDDYWKSDLIYLYQDSRDEIWVGTRNGLARFDGDSVRHIDEDLDLEGEQVYEIIEDNLGNLWLGTNRGISVIKDYGDKVDIKIQRKLSTDDLYLNETVFLLPDNRGGLWQGTNAGLNYFNTVNWERSGELDQIHFPLNESGNGIEFNGAARLLDDDGSLWFGTAKNGLIHYTFKEGATTIDKSEAPLVFLRELHTDSKVLLTGKDSVRSTIIDYNDNNVELVFNAIDYKNPDHIYYKYKLAGFDKDWQYGEDITNAKYTNLPPGDYEYLVSAKSMKSNWSSTVSLASFKVLKPYWLQWWFFILVAASLGLVVYVYINVRLDKLEKKNLQKKVDEQTEDLTTALHEKEVLIKEIHHRVKNNLAVISGLLELQSWSMPEGEAKKSIQESKLRIMAMSKVHENLYQNEDLAKVNFRKFLEDLIRGINSTVRAGSKNIELIQHVDETFVDVNIGIPVGLITNELITNSYKHAFEGRSNGTITIRFEDNGDSFRLEVYDDGVGFDEDLFEKKKSSLGISLIQSLTKQISGELNYRGEGGAWFEINIPKA
tara:strand:- start:54327 stop:57344 length:3018 start_codon:yes stop_codon:yes gene_type:complete